MKQRRVFEKSAIFHLRIDPEADYFTLLKKRILGCKARQASITKEILEIVGGAEALKS